MYADGECRECGGLCVVELNPSSRIQFRRTKCSSRSANTRQDKTEDLKIYERPDANSKRFECGGCLVYSALHTSEIIAKQNLTSSKC